MITLAIHCFLIALSLIAIFRLKEDKLSVFTYVFIWALFSLFSNDLEYPQYYLIGGIGDFIIVIFLAQMIKPTRTIEILQAASGISILLNLLGFIYYFTEISHTYYDLSYIPLILITFFAVNKGDGDGNTAIHNWGFHIRPDDFASRRLLAENKKKARN